MRALLALLAAAILAAVALPASAVAAVGPAARLAARLGPPSHLGGLAPLRLRVSIAPEGPPATDVRLYLPAGLDLATTKLGTATCRVPAQDLRDVLVDADNERRRQPCPRNALMGTGEASARLLLPPPDGADIGDARLRLYAGRERNQLPGIVVAVDALSPVIAALRYGGYLSEAPAPYGLRVRVLIPPLRRPPFGIAVALRSLDVTIGGQDVLYQARRAGRRVYYQPGGVRVPDSCVSGGLPFRLDVRFADGSFRRTTTRTPCPRPPRR